LKYLASSLSQFFFKITQASGRIIFTGHSLGGALTQELAREIYFSTRSQEGVASSGPVISVITWNALSYTSFLGRLKKGLSNVSDPIFKAGWRNSDAEKLTEFQNAFRMSQYLTAVNFHSADDILTIVVNDSFIGKLLRLGVPQNQVQAGDDVLLATDRYLKYGMLPILSEINGHKTHTLLHDALYTFGGIKLNGKISGISVATQFENMNSRIEAEYSMAERKGTPAYFYANGLNPEVYNKDGGINFDRVIVAQDIRNHLKRGDEFKKMLNQSFAAFRDDQQILVIRFTNHYGRLQGYTNYTSDLNPTLYK